MHRNNVFRRSTVHSFQASLLTSGGLLVNDTRGLAGQGEIAAT